MLYVLVIILSLSTLSHSACSPNQFDAGGICTACNMLCLTCSGSSSSNCMSCVSTRTWDILSGTCNCKDGYKENSPLQTNCALMACHYSCLTCNNTESFCTSCGGSSQRSLVAGTGECKCNSKFYDSGSATCSSCYYSCQ